ncbi:MAG: ABC transporter substrate-binding protein [Herpetosiphonaceae bacterium]|nr:ABC transporter substrate-binding protein [Herpetosiphonaceae bacterium]
MPLLALTLVACGQTTATPAPSPSTPSSAALIAPLAESPATVQNCGETVSYASVPERAVTVDVNITEMMLALGLQDRMAGIGGVSSKGDILPEYQPAFAEVPSISEKYPTLEVLLGANPDFVFAGWNYGFSEEKGLTPAVLNERGIATYILTESCIRKGARPPITIQDTFTDLRNLGAIFRVEDRAAALIAGYEQDLAAIQSTLPKRDTPLRVFVYDSGEATPFTAASEAIPTNLISLAGGANIINDIKDSWVTVGWETVIERNPEMIVIVDYGTPNAEGKQRYLLNNPALANVDAIKNKRFVVLPYAAATPGPRNAAAVRTLAEAFFPEEFQ